MADAGLGREFAFLTACIHLRPRRALIQND